MKPEDTKAKILEKALELFSENGYDAVSVDQIAKAVGIKAPSLYNHFPGKRAIFDAIVEKTARQYEDYTDEINIHVQALSQDLGLFSKISEEHLAEKMRQIFDFSLHNRAIRQFRRMKTIEQFRSPELSALYSERYVDRMIAYHAGIFRYLAQNGELCAEDPEQLALMYVSPVLTLLGICDREPQREEECVARLEKHVRLFYRTFHTAMPEAGEKQKK